MTARAVRFALDVACAVASFAMLAAVIFNLV